ncbi:MAG TPA: hypothetical protein P5277_02780 [Candidatus Paceibacterota bacterium]|nr:hypothetical protein [Candidatus Paceibacterota bacterium]
MNNKKLTFILIGITSLIIILQASVFAEVNQTPQVSYCCEKTTNGAYCQHTSKEECNSNYRLTPSSCEATSFCKKGCCYDSNEGLCIDGTPEEACKSSNGAWTEGSCSSSPQCNLGCCVLGQQAAFVTLIRCKKLASFYGIDIDFRTGVKDEFTCISLAGAEDLGACVYTKDYQNYCKMTTRKNCETSNKNDANSTIGFHKDYLCTAPDLQTVCEPTSQTTCVDGKDGVYFTDTCGNIANIYDSSKVWDENKGSADIIEYWTNVKLKSESCKTKANSKTCGNCDYLSGTKCDKAEKIRPKYGNYICTDLNCYDTSDGNDYKNGESWCYWDNDNPLSDSVGSRHYRHICMMGEEIVEPCADYRNQYCVERFISSENGKFSQAGCALNEWEFCSTVNSSSECENDDKGDCQWIDMATTEEEKEKQEKSIENSLKYGTTTEEIGICVPIIAPGLQFWDSSSESRCSIGTRTCVVKYEKKFNKEKKCVENCECCVEEEGCNREAAEQLKAKVNNICNQLGDCGAKENYQNVYVNKGFKLTMKKVDGDVAKNQGGSASPSQSSTSGTTFAGSGDTNTFAGSGGASSPTGNVIQGLMIKTFKKIKGE